MAAGALGNIAFDGTFKSLSLFGSSELNLRGTITADQNKNWVRDYGGLELIIDALVHHTDDEVVERSCGALRILSRNCASAFPSAELGEVLT